MRASARSAISSSLSRMRRKLSGVISGKGVDLHWPSMVDLQLYVKELDRAQDPSAAADILVAAVVKGTGTAPVILLCAHEYQGMMATVAARGADDIGDLELPADSPILSWLSGRDGMVSAAEARLLPQ